MSNISAVELKALEEAFNAAIAKINENVKKSQDIATEALQEVKKYGDTIEAKTNAKLTEIGTNGNKLATDLLEVRNQLLELHQKQATRPAGSGEAAKTLHEVVSTSPEWQAASKTPNAKKMEQVHIGNFHRYPYFNTVITNPNPLTNDQPLVPAQRVPGIITPAEQRLYIRDLIPQAIATSNLIEFASESSFTNNARPQGDVSPIGHGEGELKAESAFAFTLSNAPVVTIAHYIPASRQVLSDATMLQGHLSTRLLYGLKLEEEQELLTGTGGAGTLTGLNVSAAAFTGGVTNATMLDTLLRALLQVSLSNYEASAFVMHPTDWYAAMLLKDTQGRYLFSDPQSMVQPRIWAKPVVASQTQNPGFFLAGAFDLGAQIWDKEDATLRISENVASHFLQNLVVLLVEERLALTIYRSTAFTYGAVSNAG